MKKNTTPKNITRKRSANSQSGSKAPSRTRAKSKAREKKIPKLSDNAPSSKAEKSAVPMQKVWMTSIPKTELSELPAAVYGGKITVVDTPELLQTAIDSLSKYKVLGFDTETKPSFKRGEHFSVSLLQLAGEDECFLIRLNKVNFTKELKGLLENENILKVGVSIHDDFHQLKQRFELDPQGFVELQTYVKKFNISDNSLSRIYAIIFGQRISKGQRLTNWEANQLNEYQQEYAALDAVACLRIWHHLQEKGFNYKTSAYYREYEIPVSQLHNQ